CARWGTPFDFW
nr:immunoglobulin heavy chain junction region [Macaca mulatta]MOX62378.1 immunoglobulin heavy chain junction region [Macaca mulatta]MOX64624.1 immunoglobulin heavy chain junction region [Macaca mulatta]MOX66192.1 immunoglobulin heavy chain junction region [Macaca mulatta]MOX66575.1 immunoglobulin heavy chain junction region [Macaca mulatta]